jgi:ribosomal protein S27E
MKKKRHWWWHLRSHEVPESDGRFIRLVCDTCGKTIDRQSILAGSCAVCGSRWCHPMEHH